MSWHQWPSEAKVYNWASSSVLSVVATAVDEWLRVCRVFLAQVEGPFSFKVLDIKKWSSLNFQASFSVDWNFGCPLRQFKGAPPPPPSFYLYISNPARRCGLDRANPDRGAQRRGLDAARSSPNPRAWIAVPTCPCNLHIVDWFECCKDHLVYTKKRGESIREVFAASLFCLAKRWQVSFWRPKSGRRPARQPPTMVLGVRLLSIFVDSKDLLPDVAMMSRSGTPCFESRCIWHIAFTKWCLYRRRWTLPSTARRLQSFASLQSKLAISALPYSIHRSWSLLGCSCLFSCMIFLWNILFSLLQPRDRFFFFFFFFSRACMCYRAEFAGPTKKWYCPPPLATGGKRDTAPVAKDNGPYFGMPAREFLIKMYAWRQGACGNCHFCHFPLPALLLTFPPSS